MINFQNYSTVNFLDLTINATEAASHQIACTPAIAVTHIGSTNSNKKIIPSMPNEIPIKNANQANIRCKTCDPYKTNPNEMKSVGAATIK